MGACRALHQPPPPTVDACLPRDITCPQEPIVGSGRRCGGAVTLERPCPSRFGLGSLPSHLCPAPAPQAAPTPAQQPRAVPPSWRICQCALYRCRQLPSVMFSNTTPRPLLYEQAGLGRKLRQEDSFKGRSLASRLPAASFLSRPPGCFQCGAAPGSTGSCLQGTGTKLLSSLREFTGEKNL